MSKHLASLRWNRNGKPFTYEGYSRDHEWIFEGGQRLTGSAAEAFLGSPEGVDPEEAMVVALSSCHMLTLLAIAAKKGWTRTKPASWHSPMSPCVHASSLQKARRQMRKHCNDCTTRHTRTVLSPIR